MMTPLHMSWCGASDPQECRNRKNGFTLLEAIVALTIIGVTLIPIMSFLGQASRQLESAAESNQRAMAQQTVLAYIESLNPIANRTGEAVLSKDLTVRWVSVALVEPGAASAFGGRLASYQMGFYRVDIDVIRNEIVWFKFQVRKVGYQPRSQSLTGGMQ